MIITRDNYEPFFLDFLEGNLDENKIDQFLDFLEQNPDLKEELHLFENIHLPEEQVVFSGKDQLYKLENKTTVAFERKAVAYMEGDLKDEERKSFESYLANHHELQKEYDLFSQTRLVADTGIKYPEKQKLYRKSGTAIFMNWAARAAAVLVLIWGINSLFQTGNQKNQSTAIQNIASVKTPPAAPVEEMVSAIKNQPDKIVEKIASRADRKKPNNQEQPKVNQEQKTTVITNSPERDLTVIEKITPIMARLEPEQAEERLAVSRSINMDKINDPRNIMTVEEFLASRAKRVGNEGMLSVQRIFRTGLSVASEISGDRIGYSVKDGKVSSIGFESRLMAFSIPLQKK